MRQKLFSGVSLAAAALSIFTTVSAQAEPALLFDVKTGEILQHHEAFRRWHPASLTKLMTAYTAFRAVQAGDLQLDSPIRVSRYAASRPPSKMGYKPGSVLTLDNALKIIMVKSANDIAMAIGENVGGSEKAFASRMNAEAARLGMTGTHWVNPNGLHDPEQYTTARDLALLVHAIRTDFPQYASYFNIDGIVVGKKVIKTFNTLMGRFPGADGMKTGFICPSGFNLIGSATRDGRTLAAVVLGSHTPDERAEEAAEMLLAGFDHPASKDAPRLETLAPYGDQGTPTDLRDVVCKPQAKAVATDGPQPDEAAQTVAPKPSVLAELGGTLRLETITLGGANGPVPKAMQDATGNAVADVPLPTWRPDLPPPTGAEPLAQGDQPSVPANIAPPQDGRGDRLVKSRS